MAADSFSPFLGMTLQATGNNNNAWGTILNGSVLQIAERAIAGNVIHAVTGGTLDLSANPPPAGITAALDHIQILSGTLTSALVIIVPSLSKTWVFYNETTGAFPVTVKAAGVGGTCQLPPGTFKYVISDGSNNVLRLDRDQIGNFEYNSVVKPGTLQCSGQSLLRTDYPDLFATIGTTYGSADALHFTLPNLTDTGRFLRSSSGSLSVGTSQASQNLSHTHAQATGTISGVTDSQGAHNHTATVNDPGHVHAIALIGNVGNLGFPAAGTSSVEPDASTRSAVTGMSVTIASSGAHTHNVSGSAAITLNTQGGTEARPEALAVVVSIRY